MADVQAIVTAIGSLKTAAEIAKGVLDVKEAVAVQQKVIELQSVLLAAQTSALAAQSDQLTLLERIRQSEDKMAKIEAWESEKSRYKLVDFGGQTFAYQLDEAHRDDEPPHNLCPDCFNKKRKSILQFGLHLTSGRNRFRCGPCEKDFDLGVRSSKGY